MAVSFPCPAVVLLTGAQAAGKTTVAQLLTERLPRSVHEATRRKNAYGAGGIGEPHSVEQLHRALHEQTPRLGLWVDTSGQSPEQTVEELYARLPGEGRIG